MQRSALIREELEDAVAGMSPAARTVFDDIKRVDENTEPEFPEDFDALTPIERISVTKAAEHLKGLAEAEAAEDPAEDQTHSKGVSRRRRQLWIGSVLISLACLIAVGGILVSVRTAPTTPDSADTVLTTPDEVTRYLGAHVPAPVRAASSRRFLSPPDCMSSPSSSADPTPWRCLGKSGSGTRTTCPKTSPRASSCPKPKNSQRSKRCTESS